MADSDSGPEKNDTGARQPVVAKIKDSTIEESNKQGSEIDNGSESRSLALAIATPELSGREQQAGLPKSATTVPLPLSPPSTPLAHPDALANPLSPSSIIPALSSIPMPVLVTGQSPVRSLLPALPPSPLSTPAARFKTSLTPRRPVGWKPTLISVSKTEPRTHPSGPPSLHRSFTDAEVSPLQPFSPVPTDPSPRPPGTKSEASALGEPKPAASVSLGSGSSLGLGTARPVNTSRGARGLEGLGRGVPSNRRTTPRRVSSTAPLVIGGRRISSAMQYAFKAGLSNTESDQQVGPAVGAFLKDVPPLVSDTSSDEAEPRGDAAAGGSNGVTAQGGVRGGGDGGRGGGEAGGRIDAGDDIGVVAEQVSQTIGPILETGPDDHVEANGDHADVPALLAANIPACPTPDQGNEADDEGDGDVDHGDRSEAADHSSDSEDTGVSQHPEPQTIRSPASPVPHERPTDHHTSDGDSAVYREEGDDDLAGDQEAVDISNLSLAHSFTDQEQDEVWMSYVRNQLSALFPDFFDPSSLTTSTTAIPATGLPTPMTGSFDPSRQHHSEHDDADTAVMGLYGHGAYHGSAAERVPNVRMEIGSLREGIERLRGVVSGLADNMSLVDITPKVPGDRSSIEGQVQDLSAEDAEGDISLVEPDDSEEPSVHLEAGERDETGRTGIKPGEVVPGEERQLPEAFLKTAEQSYRLIKHLHQILGSTSSETQTTVNTAPATDEDIFDSRNLQDLEAKVSLWTTRPHVKRVQE